ncbi:MAG: hypothetical protein NZ890_08535 [Myxococcota bacterium]|nr:hypothetical protein [Myxococcota bacterium]
MIVRARVVRTAGHRATARQRSAALLPGPTEAARHVQQIAGLSGRLGTPPGGPGEEVVVEVDPQAAVIAQAHLRALPGEPAIMRASGVSARKLSQYLDQHAELRQAHLTVIGLRREVADTRLWLGAAQRRLARQLVRAVRARLLDPALPAAERARLRSDATELLALWAEQQERLRVAQARGRARTAQTTERMEAADRRAHLMQTVEALRRGQTVPEDDLEQAAAAWETLTRTEAQGPATDRRHRAR